MNKSLHVSIYSSFPFVQAGRYIHIRFAARTGDAMGMNMVSKATDSALHCLQKYFSNMQVSGFIILVFYVIYVPTFDSIILPHEIL